MNGSFFDYLKLVFWFLDIFVYNIKTLIDFKTLQIWERSHSFVIDIYTVSNNFPKEEVYGLTSQLRRSSVSIASNIAEGCGRNSDGELSRFLLIAMGSSSETEYQILLAKDLGYLDAFQYERLLEERSCPAAENSLKNY